MSAPHPAAGGVEADRVSPYLIFLFVLLSTATFFDGFDAAMLTIAAPEARASLGISLEQWSYVFAFTRLGMIGSFVFLLFADRFGRRALMMVTIVGFAFFNLVSGLADDMYEFALCQFFARVFLTAEYALAVIMVGEEFPARLRGLAIALLTSFATLGVMIIAKLSPWLLLGCVSGSLATGDCVPGPGNALHDVGQGIVALLQTALGRPVDHADWRVLYILGGVPLLLVFALRFGMRETRRFELARDARGTGPESAGAVLRRELANARVPWSPVYRGRTAIVTLLWNLVALVTAPSVAFWVIYAREELRFTPGEVGNIIFVGYAGGVLGHFVAAALIDRLGRKPVCAALYAFGALAIFMLFQTRSLEAQYFWMVATVFGFAAANTATHVFAAEVFPTEIRATGYAWTANLFGRTTEVLVPLTVGAMISTFGISASVSMMAFGPLLGAVLVLRYAVETRGLTLEEIEKRLAPQTAVPLRREEP
jgi:MFS transporter, putative metabolite:H+ symporter